MYGYSSGLGTARFPLGPRRRRRRNNAALPRDVALVYPFHLQMACDRELPVTGGLSTSR